MSTHSFVMSPQEKRAATSLAFIFMLRMVGLFMILPVFALYAEGLAGSTPVLVGLAIGIYGLTQAVLQIPFGRASDRYGRKPLIIFGLVIFAIGSVWAALADTMAQVIVGRAIQGAGAISATVMALAADLTREDHRLKAMAIIGASIGVSFSASLIAGPLLNSWIGVSGIFWITAVLALIGIAVVQFVVPNPAVTRFRRDTEADVGQFRTILKDGQLLRLNAGIFALHLILTACFVTIPIALRDSALLAPDQHWLVYLFVMLLALALMVPLIIYAEKKRRLKQVFIICVAAITVTQVSLAVVPHSLVWLVVLLLVFFTAFNVLEASLPSLVAKIAPPDKKGTAMGLYSSSQFLGAFCGGVVGGWIHGASGVSMVFVFCAVIAGLWLMLAATMENPRYLSSLLLNVGALDAAQATALSSQLTAVPGVAEAVVVPEDGVAYLKVDNRILDRDALISRYAVPVLE